MGWWENVGGLVSLECVGRWEVNLLVCVELGCFSTRFFDIIIIKLENIKAY
ncbi:hypothetical protein GGQ84_001055 [Desulfitispora alkaliphila]